jgi:hypothetical protein
MLETANKRHPNIKLTYDIDSIVSLLDVHIEKKPSHLIISRYYKSVSELYIIHPHCKSSINVSL